ELAANVDERSVRLNRIGGDERPFNDSMRIPFDEQTIFKRARLALVGVADEIFRFGIIFRHEAPLHAGRKACAASTPQPRSFHLVDELSRSHISHDLFPGSITAT